MPSAAKPARANASTPPLSTGRPIRHILKEKVAAQLERLLRPRPPGRRLDAGGIIVRGPAVRVRHLAVDDPVSSDSTLHQLPERDLLHDNQELIVRVGLVPAAELPRSFLAAPPPPA